MRLLSKEKTLSSLRALGRKVPLGGLPELQSVFLLQTLIGFSQALNGSVAPLEGYARALIVDGQQRLRSLQDSAPHPHLPLEQLLERIRSKHDSSEELSEEESAVQATLQVLLGLMLQWLSKRSLRPQPTVACIASNLFFLFDALFPSGCLSPLLPLRTRACPTCRTL